MTPQIPVRAPAPPPPPAPPAESILFSPPPPPVTAAARPVSPAAPAPPWRQAGTRPRFWESTFLPMGALALIGLIAAGVFGYQHLQAPQDGTPVVAAANVQLAYKPGAVHRFALTQQLSALLVLPDGRSGRAYSDLQAVEDLRVISVARDGTATIGVRVEKLTGQFDGLPVKFDPSKAREVTVVLAPDGRIVSGGTGGTLGGDATTQDPGGDLVSSILPDRDVRVGDTWSTGFRRPNPLGSGQMTYSTDNTLLRLDGMDGQQAAVVESDYSLPIDMLLNLQQLAQLTGSDGAGVPANAAVRYAGNETGRVTSYVGLDSRQLLHAVETSDFQFDMTFSGMPAGAQAQDLAGKFHFGGHLETDLQSLDPAGTTNS